MDQPPNRPANRTLQGLGLPWLALGAVFVLALGLLAAYQDSVRWEAVVWHQLLGGLLIAIFGSGIAGWGIATFIASSKGRSPPPVPADGDPEKPAVLLTIQPKGGGTGSEPGRDQNVSLSPRLNDPLAKISGVGAERAQAAAKLGIKDVADVLSASPASRKALQKVLGLALFLAVWLLALNARWRSEDESAQP